MRCESRAWILAAARASTCASSACSAGQPCAAARASISARTAADAGGHLGHTAQQSSQVEHCAPNQNRQATALMYRAQRGTRIVYKLARRIALRGIAYVEQVVCDARARGGRGLGRTDVHPAIHLRRINADYFNRQALRQSHGPVALAAAGRSGEHQREPRTHRPRRNRRSSSASDICVHVGRP